ncbi:MAG TPA: serine hydrolase domain-containing protein [Janthinobacterium sp.]|jgi:CubicO group peptidase (beta-lactamase class C family)|nr:serine hydrolase domain-containing protein [Janthinobacterium sp.]
MKQGRRLVVGLGSLLLGAAGQIMILPNAGAAPPASPLSPLTGLDRDLAAIAADPLHPMSGLSVLAIRGGKLVYQQQFGLRHIAADKAASLPVTPATMFRIASISKMMTTFGLMKLVEEGKLDLDQDAGRYLGFPLRNPHFPDRPVTLRSLLTHTSSLRDAAGYSWGADTALKDILVPGARLYGDGLMWADKAGPGAYFTYCNLNWGVIGTIMEKASGERFDRLMRRLLLAPMGVRGGYNPAEFPAAEAADIATLYRKRSTDTEIWDPAGPWIAQADDYRAREPREPAGIEHYDIGSNATLFSPTGGLRISAADMGKVMLMLMNQGSYAGKQILKPETIALMFTKQWQADGKGGNGDTWRGFYRIWGLGNQQFSARLDPASGNGLVEGAGFDAAGHLGDAYGLLSAFVVDFHNKNGMVTLIGGTGTDPEKYPGQYSALSRFEEKVLTTLYRGAIDAPQAGTVH